MPPDNPTFVGRSLGRYQLLRELGRGAMGVVYEGLDTRLARTVAIKTVQRSLLSDDAIAADYAARFEREAQAAARLHHPHIVALFDFGEQDGVSYIVMEFIRGRELAQAFREGERFTLPQVQRLMTELLDALGAAHAHGIVHRDVKPANVLLDEQGHVKLADFGVARVVDANQDRTLPGTLVGTPSAMAPEQILGLAVGSRTDIFSAGLIAYQLLTGQRPFTGSGPYGVQRAIVQDEAAPPTSLNAALPAAVDAVMAQALAKKPEHRYASAEAFAAALRQALAVPLLPAAAATPVVQTGHGVDRAPAVDLNLDDVAPPATAPGPGPRPGLRLIGLAVAAATVLLAGVWALWPQQTVHSPPAAAHTAPVLPPAPVAQAVQPGAAPTAAAMPTPTPTPTPAPTPTPLSAVAPAAATPRTTVTKTRPPTDPRCADLLARIQLGDNLSPEQTTLFHTRCAR